MTPDGYLGEGSPDRADAFIYGIYHLQYCRDFYKNRVSKLDSYQVAEKPQNKELGIINY